MQEVKEIPSVVWLSGADVIWEEIILTVMHDHVVDVVDTGWDPVEDWENKRRGIV